MQQLKFVTRVNILRYMRFKWPTALAAALWSPGCFNMQINLGHKSPGDFLFTL